MRIHLIAIGTKMPAWVNQGYQEYAKRLPAECQLKLIEIPAIKRGKNINTDKIIEEEGHLLLQAIPKNNDIIALDRHGKSYSTEMLAEELQNWMASGHDKTLLIGGPEGLSRLCLSKAHQKWSLSSLTFPHPLVRIIIAEQLYRAWSILHHHPYHR